MVASKNDGYTHWSKNEMRASIVWDVRVLIEGVEPLGRQTVYIKTLYNIGFQLSAFFRLYIHVLGFLHRISNYCPSYIFLDFLGQLYHKGNKFTWYFIIVNLIRFVKVSQIFS